MKNQISTKVLNSIRVGFAAVSSLIVSSIAFAQTTTPGVPSTALGGMSWTNIALIVVALAILIIGIVMAYKPSKGSRNM